MHLLWWLPPPQREAWSPHFTDEVPEVGKGDFKPRGG